MPELKRFGRCQLCGETVEFEGWNGHTVSVDDDHGYPEPIPCGPVTWQERRAKSPREEQLEALLDRLKGQATPLNLSMSGWIGIPTVEWDAVMAKWEART